MIFDRTSVSYRYDGFGADKVKMISVGSEMTVGVDNAGAAWMTGTMAERTLPFKVPKGAVVTCVAPRIVFFQLPLQFVSFHLGGVVTDQTCLLMP